MEQLKKKIEERYNRFFKDNSIDPTTGIWNNAPAGRELRFATMPHIGENYLNAPKKILFVGLDIGRDEQKVEYNLDVYSSFQYRSDCFTKIEANKAPNAHTAGTFIASLCLLQEAYKKIFSKVEIELIDTQCRSAVKQLTTQFAKEELDVLSNVALINYFKLVTVGRKKRVGNEDRYLSFKYISKEVINELFLDEIEILNPDIIWFQSKDFSYFDVYKKLQSMGKSLIITDHPSYLRANTPRYIFVQINNQLKYKP